MIVGNKLDDIDKRAVSFEEGQTMSKNLNVMFIEASAKTGVNIKQLFKDLASSLPGIANEEDADGGPTSV